MVEQARECRHVDGSAAFLNQNAHEQREKKEKRERKEDKQNKQKGYEEEKRRPDLSWLHLS